MNMNLVPLVILETMLVLIVAGMIVWRKIVSRHEDDQLHVLHAEAVPQQASIAKKLDVIDKWGKLITVITALVGVGLAALWIYQIWVEGSSNATFGS